MMPQNVVVEVKGIMKTGVRVEQASAGQIVDIGLNLPKDFDLNYLRRGNVLCDVQFPIPLVKTFIGKIMVYDLPMGNLHKGAEVMIYNYTNKMSAKVSKLIAIIDEKTGDVISKGPKWLKKEQFAMIQIRLDEPICMELFANYKNMGRFVIRKAHHSSGIGVSHHTVAAGTLVEFLS